MLKRPRFRPGFLLGAAVLALAALPPACSLNAEGTLYGADDVASGASASSGSPGSTSSSGASSSSGGIGGGGVGGAGTASSSGSGAGGSVGEGGGGAGGVGGFGGFGGFGGAGGSVGQGGILNLCGNGAIDAGEECDDMNITIGDGCDACQVNCKANAVEDPATHHCYFFSTISATWMDAKGDCEEIGYHLATITSQPEMDFLKGIPSTDLWIGASDSSGAWTWVTNEPWVYAPWEPMQPNNNGDCGELGCNAEQDGGTINDVNCAEVQPYLCEWAPPGTP